MIIPKQNTTVYRLLVCSFSLPSIIDVMSIFRRQQRFFLLLFFLPQRSQSLVFYTQIQCFFFSQLRVLCTPHPRPSHQRCGHSLSSPWLLVIVCAGGGVSVVGQEQYSLGSQFSSSEFYVGHIHSLNISDAVIRYNYRARLLLSVQAAGCWWWVRSRTLWAVSSAVLSPMWATSTVSICGTTRYPQTRFSVWRRRVVTLATWWLGPTCWARSTDTSDCLTPPSAPVNLAYNTVRNFIKLS